jgi:signal transduction histidine kinase
VALQQSRVRLVAAGDLERRRIERDLHDGAQQRLVAAAVQVRVAQRLLGVGSARVGVVLDRLAADLAEASAELRDLAHGIFPPELVEHGVVAALRVVAGRSPLPVVVTAEGVGRYPPEVEASVYFCCLEALQNAAKHAGVGARVRVSLWDGGGLSFAVSDTGLGCDVVVLQAGHGYTNMSDRVGAVGGTLAVRAQPGHGVHLNGHITSG